MDRLLRRSSSEFFHSNSSATIHEGNFYVQALPLFYTTIACTLFSIPVLSALRYHQPSSPRPHNTPQNSIITSSAQNPETRVSCQMHLTGYRSQEIPVFITSFKSGFHTRPAKLHNLPLTNALLWPPRPAPNSRPGLGSGSAKLVTYDRA